MDRLNTMTVRARDAVARMLSEAVNKLTSEEDRLEAIRWLALVREVIGQDLPVSAKAKSLYQLMDTKRTTTLVGRSFLTTARNLKDSDLPLALKIALPITGLAGLAFGGQAAGLAAFGSAVGVPVLLLIFLGTAGLTAVIEGFIGNDEARSYVGVVGAMIVRDELLRRMNKSLREAMAAEPTAPQRFEMPDADAELQEKLLAMDPFDFERHTLSFFQAAGLMAWGTKRSNDFGVDGFARHPEGIIVVQCKRYETGNLVGRPAVQQFKGVVEENGAWRGYLITTSGFTAEASRAASLNGKLVLVSMADLVEWHRSGLKL